MANKKPSFTAALSEQAAPAAPPPASAPARRAAQPRPDREDKTNITGYFDKPVKWQLQDLSTKRSRRMNRKITLQDLLAEALNDLFKKEGMAEIARGEGGQE